MTNDDEVARSSSCIGRSEELIVRQRALVSELAARGKPADPLKRLLDRMESNLSVMRRVHRFIETSRPRPGPRSIIRPKLARTVVDGENARRPQPADHRDDLFQTSELAGAERSPVRDKMQTRFRR